MYHSNGNGANGVRVLSVRSLAHKKLSKAERALVGASIVEGALLPQDLPLRLVSDAVGCSVSYISQRRGLRRRSARL
jgi:hypothetical protein